MKEFESDLATIAYHLSNMTVKGTDSIHLAICIQTVDKMINSIPKKEDTTTE